MPGGQSFLQLLRQLASEAQELPPLPLATALAACGLALFAALVLWVRTAKKGRLARARVADLEQELARVSAALDSEVKWRLASEQFGVQRPKAPNAPLNEAALTQ